MKRFAMVSVALLLATSMFATTWAEKEVADPICGKSMKIYEIMSYGGYIYSWPSKYDQIFWPLTDINWIRFSPDSGYAAFGPDFSELSPDEKTHLKKWLSVNYDRENPPKTHLEKLYWLEKVYQQRHMDDDFWCRFYRTMAFMLKDQPEQSLTYVRKAIPFLEKRLKPKSKTYLQLQTLYLLGEYNRRLGEPELAESYFRQAITGTYVDKEGDEKPIPDYLKKLVKERWALIETDTQSSQSNKNKTNSLVSQSTE